MKRIILPLLLSLLFIPSSHTAAQPYETGSVVFENIKVSETDGTMNISLTVDLQYLSLRKQDILLLSPILRQNAGDNELTLETVAVMGKTRYKAVKRALRLDNYAYGEKPAQYVLRNNGEQQAVSIETEIPFEEWMRDARITFSQTVTGCRDCPPCFAEYNIAYNLPAPPEPFVPVFSVAYVTPDAEPVKRRSENYEARLSYPVGKSELIRDFSGNAAILDEADRIISAIIGDEDLTVEKLKVTGYASPEGSYDGNMALSKNRAYALVSYLTRQHNLTESMIETDWKGEDWEGLRRNVASSMLESKDDVIALIDGEENIAARKRKLQSLNGGRTYRTLLSDYYPPLRRNEYLISYVARPFDIEEARKLVKTKPQYLSLNEMFLVANSYPEGSAEFREVFDIAVRMFPDDQTARVNCAAQEIDNGAYDVAIARIANLVSPQALNNLGVAYVKKGDQAGAEQYFTRAAALGLDAAAHNLEQLQRWQTDNTVPR